MRAKEVTNRNMTRGVVISFDERNGFGFIRSRSFEQDVFVHARAVDGGKLLRPGQRVRFQAEPSEKGPRAVRVALRHTPFRLVNRITPEAWVTLGLGFALLLFTLFGRFIAGWSWPIAWFAAVNVVTLAAFASDKRRAILGRRRISEALLLGLAFAGGSPAALFAMPAFRHKTHKGSFRLAFGLIVIVQIGIAYGIWWAGHR